MHYATHLPFPHGAASQHLPTFGPHSHAPHCGADAPPALSGSCTPPEALARRPLPRSTGPFLPRCRPGRKSDLRVGERWISNGNRTSLSLLASCWKFSFLMIINKGGYGCYASSCVTCWTHIFSHIFWAKTHLATFEADTGELRLPAKHTQWHLTNVV